MPHIRFFWLGNLWFQAFFYELQFPRQFFVKKKDNKPMEIEAIKAKAREAKEQAVSLTLKGDYLAVYDRIRKERDRVCKTAEERAAWDEAFLKKE